MGWHQLGINQKQLTQTIKCKTCKKDLTLAKRADGAIDFPARLEDHDCKKKVRINPAKVYDNKHAGVIKI